MEIDYQKAQIQDALLSVIIGKSSYPLFQIGEAYRRLRSFDRLLEAISQAKEKGWALSRIVDVMELEANSN